MREHTLQITIILLVSVCNSWYSALSSYAISCLSIVASPFGGAIFAMSCRFITLMGYLELINYIFERKQDRIYNKCNLLNVSDEVPKLKHDAQGLLSMAIADRDARGSIFSITFQADHHLDRFVIIVVTSILPLVDAG